MKYLIPYILIFSFHIPLHSSEYIQKQTRFIIATSATIGVGVLAAYYYWSLSSQMDAIIERQDAYIQELQALSLSLSELQKSYQLICNDTSQTDLLQTVHACENEIQKLVGDVAALKQGRGIERRSLFRSSSLKTGKE
jgi:hypothetical protein